MKRLLKMFYMQRRFLPFIQFNKRFFQQIQRHFILMVLYEQMRGVFHLCYNISCCCYGSSHTSQMQSIVSFFIKHSNLQLCILQQPINCLDFSIETSPMECSVSITVPCKGIILRMSQQQFQCFQISIGSSGNKRCISKKIASLYLGIRYQSTNNIPLFSKNGNHQWRVSLFISNIELKLVTKPFNQVQNSLLFPTLSNSQHENIFFFIKGRFGLHYNPQSLSITLKQSLFGLLKGKRGNPVDNPLRHFAGLQYFPHKQYQMEKIDYIIVMGNYNSKQQQLQYHSEYENSLYGKGTLYSSNKVPNCYIIKTLKLIQDEHIFKLYEEIENNQNIYLISLYGYILGKSCECEVESVLKKCVLTYWQFLSFSLRDCIEYRRRISVPFHENQIWHIIKAAIFGYNSFERVNVYFEFQEDYLLINHEGRVRISWQHVQSKSEHLKYYKMERQFRRLIELQRGELSGSTQGTRGIAEDGNNYRNLLWGKIMGEPFYYSPQQLRSIASLEPVYSQDQLLSVQYLLPWDGTPPSLHS